MPRALTFVAFVFVCGFASGLARASEIEEWPANKLLAGEIIMVPQQGAGNSPNKTSSATEQREKARAYRKDETSAPTTIIVVPEEESEGALSPRVSAPPERARDNRSRASDYQHGTDSSLSPGSIRPDTGILLDGGTTQERARENRSRASAYTKGDNQPVRVGPDGIPLVVCKDRDNVAGQIGDDLQSGSVFFILRDGKQVKVRCQ